MPAKNILREFTQGNYYHIYNRGVAKQPIFLDAADKRKFLSLIARHLDRNNLDVRNDGVLYHKFDEDLELLAYCLMGNHFHMLVYLKGDTKAISEFMRAITTAYTMYFNKRYKRVGPLFQGAFKASRITNDSYLQHISRYIHMNPRTYITYYYSSLSSYLGGETPAWLSPGRILRLFEGSDYKQFMREYELSKDNLSYIKSELANY